MRESGHHRRAHGLSDARSSLVRRVALPSRPRKGGDSAREPDLKTIFQNYFRLYNKLSGMTGRPNRRGRVPKDLPQTCGVAPTMPIQRADQVDPIYQTERGKFNARPADQGVERQGSRLVGTTVEKVRLFTGY